MKLLKIEYERSDDRGALIQVCTGNWKQTNMLYMKKGETFGGHFHKKRTELFYVVGGKVIMNKSVKLKWRDMVLIEPYDMHSFKATENTIILELLSKPFNEKDTWK
jgi:mannose-6-phosphate isomerase-like protein (cupin superfamily)